ncbi:hypothetical protein M758_4G083100 [Ceratodon purpureus]|uniref:Uncharacterized protein n=1 Tax=Ceratodon purpureus TaxID=3225 RepID=A0A8T0I6V7_CERPU|nr:hypothetical protein KC19_4G082200 [Ceratodon purpureus]KAG0618666.1 hypothetical protein M758_4G083100 [Ceratodon purpureus]
MANWMHVRWERFYFLVKLGALRVVMVEGRVLGGNGKGEGGVFWCEIMVDEFLNAEIGGYHSVMMLEVVCVLWCVQGVRRAVGSGRGQLISSFGFRGVCVLGAAEISKIVGDFGVCAFLCEMRVAMAT